MVVLKILIAARALIKDKERWTQEADARTEDGTVCRWNDPAAYKFCALGALRASSPDAVWYMFARWPLCEAMGESGIILFNDTHTHEQVIAAFDRAIEKEKECDRAISIPVVHGTLDAEK